MDAFFWFIAQPNVTEYVSDCVGKLVYMPAVLSMLETCAKLWVFRLSYYSWSAGSLRVSE